MLCYNHSYKESNQGDLIQQIMYKWWRFIFKMISYNPIFLHFLNNRFVQVVLFSAFCLVFKAQTKSYWVGHILPMDIDLLLSYSPSYKSMCNLAWLRSCQTVLYLNGRYSCMLLSDLIKLLCPVTGASWDAGNLRKQYDSSISFWVRGNKELRSG